MEQIDLQAHKEKDFAHNWVSSSRFLWYTSVAVLLAFFVGCWIKAYKSGYAGKVHPKDIQVPSSTQYNPVYEAK